MRSVAGRGCGAGVADTEAEGLDAPRTQLDRRAHPRSRPPVVLDAVERDYRREAFAHTGWPFTRWVRSLRPDPLRRLRLSAARGEGKRDAHAITESDVRAVLGRSSLPPATPAARSAVELATRALGDRVGEQLPGRWSQSVADAATPPGDDLGDALDRAVTRTPLRTRKPLWWAVFNLLQWLLALAAVLGLAWLAVLAGMAWLRLPEPGTPTGGHPAGADPDAAGRLGPRARALGAGRGRWRASVPDAAARSSPGVCATASAVVARELDRGTGAGRPGPPPHDARAARHRRRPPRLTVALSAGAAGPPRLDRRPDRALSTAGEGSSHGPHRTAGALAAAGVRRTDSGNTRRCGGHRAETDEVMGMNETYVTISGNVVGDPQVRRTRADVPFVTFRVASNVRRVDHKTGEYIDAGTNFVNVTAFRSLGINLANSLEKGHPVVVYGADARSTSGPTASGQARPSRSTPTTSVTTSPVGSPRSSGWLGPSSSSTTGWPTRPCSRRARRSTVPATASEDRGRRLVTTGPRRRGSAVRPAAGGRRGRRRPAGGQRVRCRRGRHGRLRGRRRRRLLTRTGPGSRRGLLEVGACAGPRCTQGDRRPVP